MNTFSGACHLLYTVAQNPRGLAVSGIIANLEIELQAKCRNSGNTCARKFHAYTRKTLIVTHVGNFWWIDLGVEHA